MVAFCQLRFKEMMMMMMMMMEFHKVESGAPDIAWVSQICDSICNRYLSLFRKLLNAQRNASCSPE